MCRHNHGAAVAAAFADGGACRRDPPPPHAAGAREPRPRRLVSSPRFRRRFLEFHRTPPMLGFICNYNLSHSRFVRTTASSPLHCNVTRWFSWCALDARHGRVLVRNNLAFPHVGELVVWDPITDEQLELPVLPRPTVCCTAAILCATATGACDHHGCHRGPFFVVFVGTEPEDMFVCTYSSDAAAWSEPISIQRPHPCHYIYGGYSPSVLLGNQLFFGITRANAALRYDLELRDKSWILFPSLDYRLQSSVLITTDDGGLGLVRLSNGVLCIWLRMEMDTPEANAGWTQFKVIDLGKQLHVRPIFIPGACMVGFADGLGIVFVTVEDALYTVDLKTDMVKKTVYGIEMNTVFPYMRFYSPALEVASIGEQPAAAGSSA